jgi:hypothetical protein
MSDRRTFLAAAAAFLAAPTALRASWAPGTMIPAGQLSWRYFADTVMGGVSSGAAATEGDAIRLTGTVSTANNGGFIQARSELADGLPAAAQGLVLRVRGNGQRYFIHLRTRATRLPWQYYQAGFETGADWREVRIPFAAFERSGGLLPRAIDPGRITSIGLVAFGRDHQADVSLAAIGTY